MLGFILVFLIILWVLGIVSLPIVIPDPVLIAIRGVDISLIDVLIFSLVLWAIGILPSPIREIAGVILFFWVLSIFGVFAVGFSSIILLGIIIGIAVAVFNRSSDVA